jgi:ABC-type nitrate/sulfonate/bicarbonate transport system substrate-binding protein
MNKYMAGIIIVAVLAMAGIGAWYFTRPSATYSGTPEFITIGLSNYEHFALIYVAEDQGYFSQNGLNVTLRNYETVTDATKGLENYEADISIPTEYVVLLDAFKKENISVIGCIDKFQAVFIVGRKDHDIANITDLKGKKIGLTRGTQSEFNLGRFLDLNGLSIQDVTLVDLPPSQYLNALVNGSVDSIVAVQKYVDLSKEQLGNNLVIWSTQSSQKGYMVLAGRNDWIASHPETISRLLTSLIQAEDYLIYHRDEAKAIVQKRMNYSDDFMDAIWPYHEYSLTLDRSLITAMNDEGQWMINNNLTNATALPDFYRYIYTKGLKEVKPEAVNIL